MWCGACIGRSFTTFRMTKFHRNPEFDEGSPERGTVPVMGAPSLRSG
ncbi:Uncharacterised protein [Legionella quateirensis]|uniref:Uncharacterized protein n=1 Tax=Legionella quateirensis TaxID=45072 RepID=A0A378KYH5_9GAMM|nr:Uncharacterised protein [Legionella quateirensis]